MWMVSRPLQSTGAVRNSPASSAARPFVRPESGPRVFRRLQKTRLPSSTCFRRSVRHHLRPSVRPHHARARNRKRASGGPPVAFSFLPSSASVGGVFDEFRPEKLITRMGNLLEASPL